jgi:hypothetical protein
LLREVISEIARHEVNTRNAYSPADRATSLS